MTKYQNWYEIAAANNAEYTKKAQNNGNLISQKERIRFHTMALVGEAGELANLVKKDWRGSYVDYHDIASELADIQTYLKHLAVEFDVDLDKECYLKAKEVADRLLVASTL